MTDNSTNNQGTANPTVIINQQVQKSNGMGTAGFVLALLAVLFCWTPVLNWILWLLGLILSGVGMTRKPKGLAIAGLVISLIGLILMITVISALTALILS